jgi:hypothetical protein
MDQSFKLLPTNNPANFRALMYETTAPNIAVDYKDVFAPHTVSQLIQFTNLNEVAHFFRLYELLPGGTLGQLFTDDIVQPQAKSIAGKSSLMLTVGVEITSDQDTYDGSTAHPDLVGMVAGQHYEIEERGVGTLRTEEFQDIGQPGFGFKLLQSRTFQANDTFFLHFLAKLISVPGSNSSNVGNKLFADIIEVTSDLTLDSSHMGKLIDINSGANTLQITLDFLNSFNDNAIIGFKQHRGNQINTIIQAQANEAIYFRGDEVNQVILSKGEHVYITKKTVSGAGKWHVFDSFGGWGDVGTPLFAYSQIDNTIVADGSLLSRSDYPRLWGYVNSSNAVINDSLWNHKILGIPTHLYEGFFSFGDGSTTFRVPNLMNMFFRGITTGRVVGQQQAAQVGEHKHKIPAWADNPALSDGTEELPTARLLEDFTQSSVTPKTTVHTTYNNNVDATKENRPINIGFLPLIKI